MNKKRYYVKYWNYYLQQFSDHESFSTEEEVIAFHRILRYKWIDSNLKFEVTYGEKLKVVAKHPVITYKLVPADGPE